MKIKSFIFLLIMSAFVACKPSPKSPEVPEEEPVLDESMCFAKKTGNDITACQLFFDGENVSGYFAWEPYETDGARGSLSGTQEGELITVVFDYMIEGSIQAEEMVFKIEGGKLFKAVGELEEKDGVLVLKDKKNYVFSESFEPVACDDIADAVERAKMVTEAIRSGN